jgi:hemerythrin
VGLDWADDLSVGNALIDSEHKNLIVVINSVEYALASRDRVALSKAMDLLDTYTRIHFRNEEKIAEAVNFPFAQNKQEHQQLLKDMRALREELEADNGNWSDDLVSKYCGFLSIWMTDHIVKEDMKLKPVLETYPYDFKPD